VLERFHKEYPGEGARTIAQVRPSRKHMPCHAGRAPLAGLADLRAEHSLLVDAQAEAALKESGGHVGKSLNLLKYKAKPVGASPLFA
jgi:hypothetical protein